MAVPSPPTAAVSDIRATSAVIDVIDGNNGGKTITARTIYIDREYTAMNTPTMGARSINSDGLTTVTGLLANTTYYYWADTYNADGWSDLSQMRSFRTYANWTLPTAPVAPLLTVRSGSSIELDWGGDGNVYGHPIEEREYAGSSDTTVRNVRDYVSNYVWTGLSPGVKYNFWARVRTRVGWSPWSSYRSATTWNVPPAPTAPTFSQITQTSVAVNIDSNGTGGATVDDIEVGYSLSSTAPPTTWVNYVEGSTVVTGLDPGRRYYWWGRMHNSVGWSALSARSQVDLIAGAYVNVDGVWKRAVPYVRVGGVWKVARPWTKIAGVWKENHS